MGSPRRTAGLLGPEVEGYSIEGPRAPVRDPRRPHKIVSFPRSVRRALFDEASGAPDLRPVGSLHSADRIYVLGNGRIVGGSSRERCADPVEGGGLSWTGKNMLVATVAKGSGAG